MLRPNKSPWWSVHSSRVLHQEGCWRLFCPPFPAPVCPAFSPPMKHSSLEMRFAPSIAPSQSLPGARPPVRVFSFLCFFQQMRLTGDHHFHVADPSPCARVRVELNRVADDVEVRALNCGAFLRTQDFRLQIK